MAFFFYPPLLPALPPGKPKGLRTARKLRVHRRDQRWHDKSYKKAHLGTALKANPFGGASHAKGIVLEKVYEDMRRRVGGVQLWRKWHMERQVGRK